MTQPILFPDAERLAIDVLTTALGARSEAYAEDVYLATAEPQTRRPRQVVVRRDGGPRLDLVREAPRLSLRVWGRDDTEAGDLARLVAALLGAAADGSTPIARVGDVRGPYRVPGADYRLLTVEFIVVGSPLS